LFFFSPRTGFSPFLATAKVFFASFFSKKKKKMSLYFRDNNFSITFLKRKKLAKYFNNSDF